MVQAKPFLQIAFCCYITYYCYKTYYCYNLVSDCCSYKNDIIESFAVGNILAFFGGILICAYFGPKTQQNDLLSNEIKQLINKNKQLEDENKRLADANKKLSDENKELSDENKELSDENKKLSKENKKLSKENKKLSKENKKLSDENKELSDENKKLSDENKKLSNENNDLLKNEEAVKNRETQLNQEVANRVRQELAKLSKEISIKKKTIKELNEELSLLLPIRSQINSDRDDLISKQQNFQMQVVRMESHIDTLHHELEHQSQDKQNKHSLQVLQKMNDQLRIFSQTFLTIHDKDMEAVQSAIRGQSESVEAMRDVATKAAESKPEIHNYYNNTSYNQTHNIKNSQNQSLTCSTSNKQYSSIKSSTKFQKNKMKTITN